MGETPTNWFFDYVTPEIMQLSSIQNILYSGRSKYQSIQVMELGSFGKCLVLDGKIQCSEADEFIYHESLVHPVMLTHPSPQTVFIAGGGEGATLREVLAHKTVKRAVMVDIDKKVIDVCRKHLPFLHQGSFTDSRTELYHRDARRYLLRSKEKFDVIIIDLPEPIEEGPAYLLYTCEFYRMAQESLAEGGVLSVQAGPTSIENLLNFTAVNNTLKTAFPVVCAYDVSVPSFGGTWGFAFASQGLSPLELSPEEIDRRIASRITRTLRFYDGLTHRGMFALPKYLRQKMEREKRIITDKEPLFIY